MTIVIPETDEIDGRDRKKQSKPQGLLGWHMNLQKRDSVSINMDAKTKA